jgi:predicted small lipoprotein YifL
MRWNVRTSRIVLILLLASIVVLPLAACGKKAAPLPPPGSTYPQRYPAP